jgi:hypothetical protein
MPLRVSHKARGLRAGPACEAIRIVPPRAFSGRSGTGSIGAVEGVCPRFCS